MAASFFLIRLDNFIEIAPEPLDKFSVCLALAGVVALINGAIGWRWAPKTRTPDGVSRDRTTWELMFCSFVSVIVLLLPAYDLVRGWIDFPSSTTTSTVELLPVSRGYRTRYKTIASYHVEILPTGSDLRIAVSDYETMLAYRPPEDFGSAPDAVMSGGHFCVKAVVQRAGDAMRIMNTNNDTLPDGSVIVCPNAV